MDSINKTLSQSDPLNMSTHAGKLERQNEKLFQLCHICLEMLLGSSPHQELNGGRGRGDGAGAGGVVLCDCCAESDLTTRNNIQHFLQQFVNQDEILTTTDRNFSTNSSFVDHFKELLNTMTTQVDGHTRIKCNKSRQEISKNRKKILTNAPSVLSLNTMLQQDGHNMDTIRRLFEFFKMQQESNRNIIRYAYRHNHVENKSENKDKLKSLLRADVSTSNTNSKANRKITMINDNSSAKFSDLVLFYGSNDPENSMDLNTCHSIPSINGDLKERMLNSSARFSIGSLSDEENDSDFSSQYETDNEQAIVLGDSFDFESDIDQILTHIHNHNWFVLPNEHHIAIVVYEDLIKNVIDPNNILCELNILLNLWRNRYQLNCARKHFLYQVMRFLFEKYVKVSYCFEHQSPCKPTVKCELFNTIATPILKQFCEHINRSRHLVIQIELLAAIESFIYNRPHFRPAIGDIFNQLFTSGIIEAVAFLEWSKLQDPSTCFNSFLAPSSLAESSVKSERSMSSVSTKSTSSIFGSKLFTKLFTKRFSLGSNQNKKNSAQKYFSNKSLKPEKLDNSLTSRDKLFDEMRSSFPLFKKNHRY